MPPLAGPSTRVAMDAGEQSEAPRNNRSKDEERAMQLICDVLAQSATKVMDLLREWDADQNGLIDRREFRNMCRSMGLGYDREILDKLFTKFDDDDSGNLDYRELVMKARKAAFTRGFIPKRDAPEPTVARKFDMYWEKRNTRHAEKYKSTCIARENAHENRRKAAVDQRRMELMRALSDKTVATRKAGVGRREKFWMRREHEDNEEVRRQKAAAPVRVKVRSLSADEEPIFLPALPAARSLAKQTWARDRMSVRTAERLEEENEVGRLQDVWVGAIIEEWKEPDMQQKLAMKLKEQQAAGKGRAPAAKHFAKVAREDAAERFPAAAGPAAALAGFMAGGGAGAHGSNRTRVGFQTNEKRAAAPQQQPTLPRLQMSSGDAPVKEVQIDLVPRTMDKAESLTLR